MTRTCTGGDRGWRSESSHLILNTRGSDDIFGQRRPLCVRAHKVQSTIHVKLGLKLACMGHGGLEPCFDLKAWLINKGDTESGGVVGGND